MDDTKLWIVGALALAVVVAALIWVLRQRGDSTRPVSHDYSAPEVTLTGQTGVGGLAFGDAAEDVAVDQTVPLSRLGGAGWRDGGAVPAQTTTDAYAGESPSWADDQSAAVKDPTAEHHVEIDQTIPRSVIDEELDRERGGHW